jgi:hypothetical protein
LPHATSWAQLDCSQASGKVRGKRHTGKPVPFSQPDQQRESRKGKGRKKGHGAKEDKAAGQGAPQEEAKVVSAYKFQTEMREGETFRSYSRRIGIEKRRVLIAQAEKLKRTSGKRKQFLDDRKKRGKEGKRAADDSYGDAKHEKGWVTRDYRIKDFEQTESVRFGEVADRPPDLSVVPKQKKRGANIVQLTNKLAETVTEADLDRLDEEEQQAIQKRREQAKVGPSSGIQTHTL